MQQMNIAQHIEKARLHSPNKLALIFENTHYSYQELDQQANQVANGLAQLGIRVGDRVALFLPNIPEFMFSYLGIIKLGAIAVSLNVQLQYNEIQFIVNDSQATAMITTPELAQRVPITECPSLKHVLVTGSADASTSLASLIESAPKEYQARAMQPHDPAAIVYSSGTTGFPKGVTLSHHNIISNMQAKNRYCDMRSSDRLLLCVPLFHCFGQNAIFNSALNAGATIVLHRSFNLDLVLRSIQSDQVTMFFGVPTIYLLLLNKTEPEQFHAVRYFFSGAAILPLEIAQRWYAKYKLPIHEGYGLTETSPFAAYNHISDYKLGSVGVPIEQVEIKIVDIETDVEVLPDEVGEIIIRGPNVMLGYWNNPTATAQAIRDGWFYTGDLGKKDQAGYLFIVDRLKDMINVAGIKVYPAEVENVIYQLPEVAEVAVYGVADAITGERVEAQIVFKANQQLPIQAIIAFCRQHMASFKVPTAIKVVDSIPKNPTGKVLKRLLRNEAGA